MSQLRFCLAVAMLAGLAACIERSTPPSGIVFAGPSDLPLHEDIKPKSKVTARVPHGERLEIVQQRRRLYKLRTTKGLEGWTDERNLMSVQQMDALARLEKEAQRRPSQGAATCFEPLNVHTEPQRFSPSFIQIREGEKFDVIAHQTASRAEPAHRVLVKAAPRAATPSRKHGDRGRFPLPPAPAPPKLPDDWLELSEERAPPRPTPAPAPPPTPAHGRKRGKLPERDVTPTDDWTLVRTARGAAGWVLTSRIYLSIPDEVAQYAEGRRITTYFSLGKIHDDELNADKNFWLWTTIHAGDHPFDFDSFRVFTWNPKKHRYETAYIQRTVEGYLPVIVKNEAGQETFSVCLTGEQGVRERKRFAMVDRLVRAVDTQACADESLTAPRLLEPAPQIPEAPKAQSLTEKLKRKAADVKKRLTGK